MIVVDASVWVRALIDSDPSGGAARDALASDQDWAAPAHMPVEVLRTIRRYESQRLLTAKQATAFAEQVCAAEVSYAHPQRWLLEDVWRYRFNISPYDAAYVALAAHTGATLITRDEPLARAAEAVGVRVHLPIA